ncbi:MAG TPA: DinB family protein [Flavobacteriales bacterium]|nr:DinB family protein [Flavobacteriales bacterium]
MKINSNTLIEELIRLTDANTKAVEQFKTFTVDQLNHKVNKDSWSILECIEHLNLYGDYYLPEIQQRILAQKPVQQQRDFKSGVLGGYFANLMRVQKNGKLKKMKSPKDKNPANSNLNITTLDRFFKQQELLKSLLNQAKTVDLMKTKTSISISKMVKLRLGDTFRFLIYHIERHIQQANRVH